MRRVLLGAAVLAALAVAGEVGARALGIANVPLYSADPVLGYVPQPSQSGRFLGHDWTFNSLSMGSGPFTGGGTLLIGDSIVFGEAGLSQSERLGPALSRLTHAPVWPISAQSWALINEIAYLNLHPDVVARVDRIVFVTNSGDFTTPSVWRSNITHPQRKPVSALLFALERGPLQKYLPAPPAAPEGPWKQVLGGFHPGKPVTFVLYSQRRESPAILAARARDMAAIFPTARYLPVSLPPGDFTDQIHPNAHGRADLARAISTP